MSTAKKVAYGLILLLLLAALAAVIEEPCSHHLDPERWFAERCDAK